jgi:hypothetical protein
LPAQARREGNSFETEQQLHEMNLEQLQCVKQRMESEYARIPITVTGKSLHVQKRKEALEYELDLIEKYIHRQR